jgi:hypothetical protein
LYASVYKTNSSLAKRPTPRSFSAAKKTVWSVAL